MVAQRMRAETLVENLANADTTRTPDGGPYKRKDVVFQSADAASPFASIFAGQIGASGVEVSDVLVDQSAPERRYQPGHPDADADGYVAYPNVKPAEDMVDLMGASRGYQANVAAIGAVKEMIQRSFDLFR